MELLTLDDNYQAADLIEGYSSLLWTERYSTTGDFQLVTTDVERMLQRLPLETPVAIRESTVPMIVEAHKIKKKANSAAELTVIGRSFESVLERRAVALTYTPPNGPKDLWIEQRENPSDAAYWAIRKTIGDVARPPIYGGPYTLGATTPALSPNDALPMLDTVLPKDYDYEIVPSSEWEIKFGNLYRTVMDLLAINHHGLKAYRPESGSNQIGLEIYNGADLTDTVVFDAKFDQFTEANYLLSKAGSNNMAYVFSLSANSQINKNTGSEPTGLDRRVLYLDIADESGTDNVQTRETRGLVELYNNNVTALFDGQIGEQVAGGFNRDYFLGDIVKLDGEYGLSENVRVAEFIRSDDSTGSKAYPTFEVVV